MKFHQKVIQSAEIMILMIWADFDDPRADFPLQNLCNSLGFSRSGLVSCVPWGAGTDFRNFKEIYGSSWNLREIIKFHEFSWKIKKFNKFYEISNFEAIHPSESLIFLRKYWCFCDLLIFTKIMIFKKKVEIFQKFTFSCF